MADIGDKASALSEQLLTASLRNINTTTVPFSGLCLSCEEPIGKDRRYCDRNCRDDHERSLRKR